jgi:hypothetical protein
MLLLSLAGPSTSHMRSIWYRQADKKGRMHVLTSAVSLVRAKM